MKKVELNKIFVFLVTIFIIISCNKNSNNIDKPILQVDKIILIKNNETYIVCFKVKFENKNEKSILFLDNSMTEFIDSEKKYINKGFYLKNKKNDSIIPLSLDNYNFYEIGAKKKGFIILGTNLMQNINNDNIRSNFVIEYNGNKLNYNTLKENNYINKNYLEGLLKRKNKIHLLKDTLNIKIPKNIKIKSIDYFPITHEEWGKI